MKNSSIIPDEQITVESLIKLAHTIDMFEQYMRPHASQIARMAEALALRVGILAADLNALKIAALMHDIGEMIMDSPALRKSGYIDFKHKIELWRHPIIGEQQLAKRELPKQAQLLVRWHHEWWNGSGYPDMLSREMIPIGARILRLVDTYNALTANRPYREAFSTREAQEIIQKSAGIEFDPYLVKVFLEMLEETSTSIIPQITESPALIEPTESSEELPEIPEIESNQPISTIEENSESYDNLPAEPVITPDNPNIPTIEEPQLNNDLIESPSEELVNLVPSNDEGYRDIIESKPDLGTQSLFAPSSDLTRDLLNTSYLSEPIIKEPIEFPIEPTEPEQPIESTGSTKLNEDTNEDTNNLLTTNEEKFLDKSQENVENKSE